MTNSTQGDLPLDFLCEVRDELIQGESTGHVVTQACEMADPVRPTELLVCRRCDTGQREVVGQSHLLNWKPEIRLSASKIC